MTTTQRCPLCNQVALPDPKASVDMPLCTRCQRAWNRAHAHDATVGSLVDLARASGGSFTMSNHNYAGPNTDSQEDFDRARKAIDDALDADNCVGQGRKAMLDELQKALEQMAWFATANAIPTTNPKRIPKLHITITGCTAEVSVDPVYPRTR